MGTAYCCGGKFGEGGVFEIGHVSDCFYLDGHALGAGLQGYVVFGNYRRSSELVAVKVIRISDENDEGEMTKLTDLTIRQLEREIVLAKGCQHDNLSRTFSAFWETQQVQIVMEAAAGGEVAQDFSERGFYGERDVKLIVTQLAQALCYLHSRNMVHRDVKLENVRFSDSIKQTVKLVDFGFIRKLPPKSSPFLAPELFHLLSGDATEPRTSEITPEFCTAKIDIWAMGVFSFLLLTGIWPFDEGQPPKEFKGFPQVKPLGVLGYSLNPQETPARALSLEAQQFVRACLVKNDSERITATGATTHAWILEVNAEDSSRHCRILSEPLAATLKSHKQRSNGIVQHANYDTLTLLPSA